MKTRIRRHQGSTLGRLAVGLAATVLIVWACGAQSSSSPSATPIPEAPTASVAPTSAPTPTPVATRSLTPTIPGPPSNDNPPGTVITALPFTDSTNTALAQIHAMEPSTMCGSGGRSVWYSYTAAAGETLTADSLGSDYDTILDVWQGVLTNDYQNPGFETLKPIACDDDTGSSTQSQVVFAATAGESFVIRVLAKDGVGGTLIFHLSAS